MGKIEVKEAKKKMSYKKIPTLVSELNDSRTILNEELPVTMQSEAFDVGFVDHDYIDKRKSIW